jgi:hypothetical protein
MIKELTKTKILMNHVRGRNKRFNQSFMGGLQRDTNMFLLR